MSCPEPSTLQAYFEARALAEEKAAIRAHFEVCADCRALAFELMPDPPQATNEEASPGEVLERGSHVGRYILLRRLGSGGMGVVFAAYDPELDRKVAIKLIGRALARDATTAGEMQERLLREAQAMARIAHPNVASVFDVGRHGEQVFLAMELIDGETLALWLAREPRAMAKVIEVFKSAGRGLAAAHSAGVVHRDFKPNNVMIDRDGRVRVLDFGLARPEGRIDDELGTFPSSPISGTLTVSGVLLGTPAYMAPEQLEREPADARTDQFSFCVALYEALCGTRPFVADDTDELRTAIRESKLQRPRRPVSKRLLDPLTRGLRPKPDERWPSMESLLTELAHDPARLRRQVAVGVGALGLLIVGSLSYWHALKTNRDLCAGSERRLIGVWDVARRQLIAGGAAAIDRQRLASALDDQSLRWTRHRKEVCEDTRVRGEQSEQALELRMECLDQQLLVFNAFIDEAAASSDLPAAVRAVRQLPAPSQCDNVAVLREVAVPATPRATLDALKERVARLRATALLDPQRALDESSRIAVDARAAGAMAILGRALDARGTLQSGFDQDAQASVTLHEAALVSSIAHDSVALLDEVTALIGVEGGGLLHFEEAERLATYANTLLDQVGRAPNLEYLLASAQGVVEWHAGRFEASSRDFKRALDLFERLPNTDPPEHVRVIGILAVSLGDSGHFDEARALNQRALALTLASPDADHLVPSIEMAIARDLYIDGHTDEAIVHARRAVDQLEGLSTEPSELANALAMLGACMSTNRPAAAIPLLDRALALLRKAKDDNPLDRAAVLSSLGVAQLALGQIANARVQLEAALALQAEPALRDTVGRAETEWALARALGGGARAVALAQHARGVLMVAAGARRKALFAEADSWLATVTSR